MGGRKMGSTPAGSPRRSPLVNAQEARAIRESAWHVRAPQRASSIRQRPARAGRLPLVLGPRGDPRPGCLGARPPAVSLFSDVTPGPRPSPTHFSPLPSHLHPLLAPETPQPPKPGPSWTPPRSPVRAAPPCALPNLPLLFQLPSSPPTPRQAAKRGARSPHHTWNPKRALCPSSPPPPSRPRPASPRLASPVREGGRAC